VRLDSVRPLLRELFHAPERLLHPWRRRAAAGRVRRRGIPRTVLFVCHGNICRSPYAAAAARRRLPPATTVLSAGFFGPDRPSPPEAVQVASEHGLDLGSHRARLLEFDHLREVDLVLVMDVRQRRRLLAARPELAERVILLGDLDPEPVTRRAIPDPVEKPAAAFRACYTRIDRCVGALAALGEQGAGDGARGEGRHLEDRAGGETDR
jgi:protein-tyrosine-phosphatase